jgi:hypothetical protein
MFSSNHIRRRKNRGLWATFGVKFFEQQLGLRLFIVKITQYIVVVFSEEFYAT